MKQGAQGWAAIIRREIRKGEQRRRMRGSSLAVTASRWGRAGRLPVWESEAWLGQDRSTQRRMGRPAPGEGKKGTESSRLHSVRAVESPAGSSQLGGFTAQLSNKRSSAAHLPAWCPENGFVLFSSVLRHADERHWAGNLQTPVLRSSAAPRQHDPRVVCAQRANEADLPSEIALRSSP